MGLEEALASWKAAVGWGFGGLLAYRGMFCLHHALKHLAHKLGLDESNNYC